MSVDIILSSKQIELDQHNHAILNLKALFAALPSAIVALYKVRTNSKDMVDVRPSFGMLTSRGGDDSVATMNIKYLGNVETLKKMKLQISWVWGEGIPEKKLNHVEFSELYASLKQKIDKEKTHMLEFTTKDQAKREIDSLIIHDKSKNSENSDSEDGLEGIKVEEANPQENQGAQKTKSTPTAGRKTSWIWIALGVLLAFMLGVLTGIKLQGEVGFLNHQEQNRQTMPTGQSPELLDPSYPEAQELEHSALPQQSETDGDLLLNGSPGLPVPRQEASL